MSAEIYGTITLYAEAEPQWDDFDCQQARDNQKQQVVTLLEAALEDLRRGDREPSTIIDEVDVTINSPSDLTREEREVLDEYRREQSSFQENTDDD